MDYGPESARRESRVGTDYQVMMGQLCHPLTCSACVHRRHCVVGGGVW
jgi:hypothetical protein